MVKVIRPPQKKSCQYCHSCKILLTYKKFSRENLFAQSAFLVFLGGLSGKIIARCSVTALERETI